MTYTLVTAYYPIKSKHTIKSYLEWIQIFFNCVSCNVICFCPNEIYPILKSMAKDNVSFIIREFNSFEMMSEKQMTVWKEFHTIDSENSYHTPELYAVWAAKQEFVREAIRVKDYDTYVWCDVGCFRYPRDGSFKNVEEYILPGKITCLSISNLIGGGVLAGDKNAWNTFSRLYLEELNKNPHGKDQVIFKRILNDTNAFILNHTYLTFIPRYDEWFFLTYIFSYDIPSS